MWNCKATPQLCCCERDSLDGAQGGTISIMAGAEATIPLDSLPLLSSSSSALASSEALQIGESLVGGDKHGHEAISSKPRRPDATEVIEELFELLRTAMPLILAGLLLYPRGMISMYFLGSLGELELAGGALAIAFANITGYSVLYGLALGMEPICGQAYGAKQWNVMTLTTKKAIIGLMWASLPIICIWINMQKILLLFGQDKSVTAVASIYVLYSIPDLLIQCILHPLRIHLRSQNVTIPLSVCAGLALPLHVLANMFFVSVLHMGIRGVALAAIWTNLNMLILLLTYLKFSRAYCMESIWTPTGWIFNKDDWDPLVKLAIPSCVLVCLEWWWYELMIILSGLLAEAKASVATMGILIQITALVYIFPSSLSLAVSTRVSNQLGANRPAKARLAVIVASCCAVFMGFCAMAFTTSIKHAWGRMFTTDETILRLTAMALPIIGLCELGNSPQTTGCGVLRGSARPSIGVKINLASFYIIGLPVSVILVFGLGVGFVGIWLGLLAAQATCAISMLIVMVKTNWLVEAERSKGLLTRNMHQDGVRITDIQIIVNNSKSKHMMTDDMFGNASKISGHTKPSNSANLNREHGAHNPLNIIHEDSTYMQGRDQQA